MSDKCLSGRDARSDEHSRLNMQQDAALLALVRNEATKFGRCCDLYQDGFGTFADHECQQRTFAMLRGVQAVLGVAKDGSPLSDAEIESARSRAHLIAAAPDLLLAAKDAKQLLINDLKEPERTVFWNLVHAITKAEGH